MSTLDLNHVLAQAVAIARRTGEIIREGFAGEKQLDHKSSRTDLVTDYDTRCEKLIHAQLHAAFPAHHRHGEEGGVTEAADESAFTWYIDPIDGTNNFAHGLPHFCVTLGLYEAGTPRVGVTYDPIRDELFTAVAGQGAFMESPILDRRRIHVSATTSMMQGMFVTGFPYDKHRSKQNNVTEFAAVAPRVRGIRRTGSAALDMAYIAAGRFDGYWEYKLNPWDIAAGILLVQEAGGRLTDLAGEPLVFHPTTIALAATNGHVHDELLGVLCKGAIPQGTP